MLRIAVCDDEPEQLEKVAGLLRDYGQRRSVPPWQVFPFPSGYALLDGAEEQGGFDLYLLDVLMPGLDGIQTGAKLRAQGDPGEIVYLTNSRDHAVESYGVRAFYYLVKPVEAKGVEELFRRYLGRLRQPPPQLEIRAGNRVHRFPVSLVQKIQSSRKGVDVYLKGAQQPQRVAVPLMKVEEQADPSCFLKVSRGLLVQMEYIESMDRYSCRLKDGTSALLSRKNRAEIQRKYHDFLFWNLMKEDGGY